jgi:Cdc6-like AAA superfamily ATPase
VSHDALAAAKATPQAFDPTPMPDSLAICLAPYEQLVPGCNLESELRTHVTNHGRVGLVGAIGSGKSSVSRYALGTPELAMIALNVVTEDREKIATVRGFLEILVSQLLSRANFAGRIPRKLREDLLADATPTLMPPRTEISTRGELGGAFWLLRGGVAKQVTRTLAGRESYRSTHDLRQAAKEALAAITGSELVPVLLADDTDRLLRVAGPEQAEQLFRGFFGEVLREISEQLECGLILAIHDSYLTHKDFQGFTTGRIVTRCIPRLTESGQLAQIISRRAEFLAKPTHCEDLLTQDGLDRLTAIHCEGRDGELRTTLSIFHQALALACKDGSEQVDEHHIRAADPISM